MASYLLVNGLKGQDSGRAVAAGAPAVSLTYEGWGRACGYGRRGLVARLLRWLGVGR